MAKQEQRRRFARLDPCMPKKSSLSFLLRAANGNDRACSPYGTGVN